MSDNLREVAEKLAEEIIVYFVQIDDPRRDEFKVNVYHWIDSALREVEKEAFKNGRLDAEYDKNTLPEQIEAYKRNAWNQAIEEAAKVANKCDQLHCYCSERIRALKLGDK